jgi:hypothetical protein
MTVKELVAGDSDNRDERTSTRGLMDVPVPVVQARDIDEDFIPPNKAVAYTESANIELRRWVVGGVGGLIALLLILAPAVVVVRPEAANFASSYVQTGLAGLIGIAGSVVAFLFVRDKSWR